ncbi:MAG: hydrogenase nickel incorporation protein HypA [Elusimicrobiales bacterium]
MHEWALVDAVAEAARRAAEAEKMKRVDTVAVVLGELQNIDRAAAKSLFLEIRKGKGPALRGARLAVSSEKAAFKCRNCGRVFGMAKLAHNKAEAVHFLPEMAHVWLRCPRCKSADFSVEKGRGIYIKEITGEK